MPSAPRLCKPGGDLFTAAGQLEKQVRRDVVADPQHEFEEVAHSQLRAGSEEVVANRAVSVHDVSLPDVHEVVEGPLPGVDLSQDLDGNRDLVRTRHGEALIPVEEHAAARLEVHRGDADNALRSVRQPFDLGPQRRQGGLIAQELELPGVRGRAREQT